MDSTCCIRLDIPLATSQHRCNEATFPFQPTYPHPFSVVSWPMPNYKTVFDARHDKGEVPAEVFLAGHFRCLMPLATQLLCQPLRQVVPEATGINEIFSWLGHVKGGAL